MLPISIPNQAMSLKLGNGQSPTSCRKRNAIARRCSTCLKVSTVCPPPLHFYSFIAHPPASHPIHILDREQRPCSPTLFPPPYNIPRPRYSDWVVPLLAEAWDAGIPVISSTGNVEQAGLVDTMGDASPQRFVTPDNPLIVVGGASADGSPSQYNMPAGPPSNVNYDQQLQGGVTVYSHSENVEAAIPGNAEHPYDNYLINSGSSYACSYASGLAAYYLGLPTTVMPPRLADIPHEMKRILLRSARDGSQGGKGVIHNGVWDLPCSPPISPGSKKALRSSLSEAHRVLRKLKGLDGLMYE